MFLDKFKGPRPDNYGNDGQFKVLKNKELQDEFNNWSKLQYY